MSDIRDLIPQEQRQHVEILGLWQGQFAYDVALVTDVAYVVIPDIDPNSVWGPCYWMPRVIPEEVNVAESAEGLHLITIPKIIFPHKGNACLIAFDNRKVTWVVTWWPT